MAKPPAPIIDIRKALRMRLQGQTYPDIAATFGVTKQAVHDALKPLLAMIGDTSGLPAYQENKAGVMDAIQMALAGDLLDPVKRAKATLGNVAYAVRQLNDISRLERDLSTANVAHAHIDAMKTVAEVDAEIAKLTNDLAAAPANAESAAIYKDDADLAHLEQEIAKVTGADGVQDGVIVKDSSDGEP